MPWMCRQRGGRGRGHPPRTTRPPFIGSHSGAESPIRDRWPLGGAPRPRSRPRIAAALQRVARRGERHPRTSLPRSAMGVRAQERRRCDKGGKLAWPPSFWRAGMTDRAAFLRRLPDAPAPCPSSGPRRPEPEGGPVTDEGVLSVLAGGPRSFFFSRDHSPISAYFRPLPAFRNIRLRDA